ncbi:hypothetical protein CDAR_465481 [Caerostris darwini]|uniref:Uncharacterized protein n=1 Tax=Caerostris darwini TaxID=1538125 RepID=A0AAV4SBP1_9ARAC|nr:hypothetical protein CDAR_465481 [Caerostris darwini]
MINISDGILLGMQVLSVISPMDHEATEELSSSAKSSVRNYTSAMDQGSNAIDQHCQMEQRTEKRTISERHAFGMRGQRNISFQTFCLSNNTFLSPLTNQSFTI